MRVLVIGGYGVIGSAIVAQLLARGHSVLALGRNRKSADKAFTQSDWPQIDWVIKDLNALTEAEGWSEILVGIDGVINAAGALQTGLRDNLSTVHDHSIKALVRACEMAGVANFVQISAPDAQAGSALDFYSSKATGDNHVKKSQLNWVIMRPGIVIGRTAYGGTHLLRAVASFPYVQPVIFSKKRAQTVGLTDVAHVASDAVEGKLSFRSDFDLVEDNSHSFSEILALYRNWLGIAPARFEINVPLWLAWLGAKLADGLSWLGWRLPFRTTSLRVMHDNVLGDSAGFKAVSTRKVSSLRETLAAMPASSVERVHARISLLMPLLLITLSGFWLASGIIGLRHVEQAIAVLPDTMDGHMARTFVIIGSVVDIALGLLIWLRKWTRAACLGMVFVTLIYLIGASVITPHLWADPMGVLVKSIPAMILALFTSFFLEER